MAKDPAFLFYSSDFLTGTMFMTNEQVGKYIRLLCAQHQKGHLTEKDMLFICGSHDEHIFSKFIKDEAGLYYNERCEDEINKRKKYSESRSNNRKSATKERLVKPNSNQTHDKSYDTTYDNHMEIENVNEIIIEVRSIDKYKENFDNDYVIDEKASRENGFNQKQLEKAKFEFWNTKELDSEMLVKQYQDVQKHFLNWCRKNKERLKKAEAGEAAPLPPSRKNKLT